MSGKDILLIANPRARSGNTDLSAAIEVLAGRGFAVHREFVSDPGQIAKAIRRLAGEVDCVVLGGGDGTLNRAAAALLAYDKPLGILPMGTANDLARTLGIPFDPVAAAGIIAEGHTRVIDLGCINEDVWFFNVAHIGLGALVTRRLSGEKKRFWGKVSYLRTLLETWRAARPFEVELVCDGRREYFASIEVAVGNGRSYGGGMTIASGAAIDDQLLHVFSLDPQGFFRMAALVPALFTGDYGDRNRVRFRSGQEITVRTDTPRKVVTDGEETAVTPARFTVRQNALKVFVPAEEDAQERKDAAKKLGSRA